jgi:putrescine aminotransferase
MKSVSMKGTDKGSLTSIAEKVFSKSLIRTMAEQGHDFLEGLREGAYVFDENGNRYLDCYTSAGTFNLGRKNKTIAASLKKAIFETDQGNFVMPSQEKALLARRISRFMPGNLECVLFGVTRGESMDAALKLARGFTGRSGIVTVDSGCYGETGFALSISQRKGKEQFGALIPDVHAVPFGDMAAARTAAESKPAAFVMEPIQAENHCRTASNDYYAEVRALCDRYGIKLIFDETQSGFGRTGRKFFFEHTGTLPDILIVGEAITGGIFPMTAIIFTPELKAFFDMHPLIHLCTFGGHDLGCRAAMEALDEYDRQSPWDNAHLLGEKLLKDFQALAEKNAALQSVSGKGLLISLKLQSGEAAFDFCRKASGNGLLVNPGKIDESCVVLRPSLLIGQAEATFIADTIAMMF